MGLELPLCRWPFPRLCGFPSVHWAGEVNQRPILSSSFGLRIGRYPVHPSRPGRSRPAPPWSFPALQHIKPRGSTARGFCLPATFRPQGLVTLSAAYSPRGPAGSIYAGGAPGLRPSELALAKGTRTLLHGSTHIPFCPQMRRPPQRTPGSNGSRFLGFDPWASPCRARRRLTCWSRGSSLGLFPSRASQRSPGSGFRRNSSRVLADREPKLGPGAPQSLDR
jgi:hypothetical protein